MFDLFRFTVLRPPEAPDGAGAIPITPSPDLAEQLRVARASDDPRTAMKQVADTFLAGDTFVGDVASLAHAQALASFRARLSMVDEAGLDWLGQAINEEFSQPSGDLVAGAELQADKQRLHDSIITGRIGLQTTPDNFAALVRTIRLIALIERVAAADADLNTPGALAGALNRTLLLPASVFPLPPAADPGPVDGSQSGGETTQEGAALVERYEHLQTAFRLLSELEPEDIELKHVPVTLDVEDFEAEPTEVERRIRMDTAQMLLHESARLGESSQLDLQTKLTAVRQLQDFVNEQRVGNSDGFLGPVRQAEALEVARLTVRPAAAERFSGELRAALSEINVSVEATNLPQAVERIRAELTRLTPGVNAALKDRAARMALNHNVIAVGQQFFPIEAVPDILEPLQVNPGPAAALPATHGTARPVGVGDLLVVRQQLVGYELGEVAYIENVLKGEVHTREVRRSETIEQSSLTEQETTRSEERDLQSTERFELQRESENILRLDGQVRGEGFRSPGYGPVIEFENEPGTPLLGSRQHSERTASRFSNDVTSRAASRVTERVRTQVMRRTVRQIEDRNEHTFNNEDGTEHVVGVYQWINKRYQAQTFNYGKRLFYDLVVPEPAAFLNQAFARGLAEGRGLDKPDPFTVRLKDGTERPLQPDDINDTNYAYYVARYAASGVKAPPDPYITVTKVLVGATEPTPDRLELAIPEGYEAATRMSVLSFTSNLGRIFKPGMFFEPPSTLDIDLTSGRPWRVTLGCRRKDSVYKQWQINTYEAVLRAFRQQMGEYEERLANQQAALRVGALGLSSDHKRALERNELKKACITLFTHQHFDIFDGIDSPGAQPVLYPQLNLANAEPQGRYIRFFEEAFEWEQMMYHFYPYFWGRKQEWTHKAMLEDRDPQFAEFLRAGAARTLVPVRPGFENAILYFMETGEIWRGGELPAVIGLPYLPLLEELKTAASMPENGLPYGEPWEVTLPTTLVMLRPDGSLPRWRQEDGQWVPVQ